MKNFSHLFKTSLLPRLEKRNRVKTTEVEGLALDSHTRRPLEGVRIAIHLLNDHVGRVQVFETVTDNNGYFTCAFQAEEDVFTITPYKESFTFTGTFVLAQDNVEPNGCEEVKFGKRQFFTFALETGLKQRQTVPAPATKALKNLFYLNFQRVACWLGLPSFMFV